MWHSCWLMAEKIQCGVAKADIGMLSVCMHPLYMYMEETLKPSKVIISLRRSN